MFNNKDNDKNNDKDKDKDSKSAVNNNNNGINCTIIYMFWICIPNDYGIFKHWSSYD